MWNKQQIHLYKFIYESIVGNMHKIYRDFKVLTNTTHVCVFLMNIKNLWDVKVKDHFFSEEKKQKKRKKSKKMCKCKPTSRGGGGSVLKS